MMVHFPLSASFKVGLWVAASLVLASCVSSDGLESAATTSNSPVNSASPSEDISNSEGTGSLTDIMTVTGQDLAAVPVKRPEAIQGEQSVNVMAALPGETNSASAMAVDQASNELLAPQTIGPQKTYLINGLLSAVPFIGYGFRNLNKKMPEAKLYSYMGVVEGPAVIAPAIIKDAEAAYRADPTTAINLIGISLGADLITVIAAKLADKNIPVNYLGIVDGTHLQPIRANVRKADNLTCSNLDCTRAKVKLAPGNTATKLDTKIYSSSHIPLGDHDEMHARVIAQSGSL